jgi:hypothetical protein
MLPYADVLLTYAVQTDLIDASNTILALHLTASDGNSAGHAKMYDNDHNVQVCVRMLTYADVCLTYSDAKQDDNDHNVLICVRMLTQCMLAHTYADVCCHSFAKDHILQVC